jgi:hypothetical protein
LEEILILRRSNITKTNDNKIKDEIGTMKNKRKKERKKRLLHNILK